MAGKIVLDLKNFKHVSSDKNTTTLQHKKLGHSITLHHPSLAPESQEQLKALAGVGKANMTESQSREAKNAPKKMANGGEAQDKEAKAPVPNKEDRSAPAKRPPMPKLDLQGSHGRSLDDVKKTLMNPQSWYKDGGDVQPQEDPQAMVNMAQNEQAQPSIAEMLGQGVGVAGREVGNVIGDNLRTIGSGVQAAAQQAGQFVQGVEKGAGVSVKDAVAPEKPKSPEDVQIMPVATPNNPTIMQNQTAPPAPVTDPLSQTLPQNKAALDYQSMLERGYAEEKKGALDAAAAQGQLGRDEAENLKQGLSAQQEMVSSYQQSLDALNQERQAHIEDIHNGHIDPELYWKDHVDRNGNKVSGHSKVMAAIGMILSGFDPSGRGGEGAAGLIKRLVEQNIDAQKANLNSDNNLLNANLQQFHNMKDAMDMTRLMQADMITNSLKAAASKAATPIAQAKALAAIGQIDKEYAPLTMQMGMRQAMMGLANGGGSPQAVEKMLGFMDVAAPEQAKMYRERYVPGVGIAQLPIPQEARKELLNHDKFMRAAQDLREFTVSHRTIVPGTPSYNVGVQKALILQTMIREGMLGTVYKESEQPLLDKMIKGNPANLLKEFNTLPQLQELMRSNESQLNSLKQTYGLPQGHSGQSQHAAPAQPQYKTVNGVKYMRGPQGQAIRVP